MRKSVQSILRIFSAVLRSLRTRERLHREQVSIPVQETPGDHLGVGAVGLPSAHCCAGELFGNDRVQELEGNAARDALPRQFVVVLGGRFRSEERMWQRVKPVCDRNGLVWNSPSLDDLPTLSYLR